MKFWFGFGGALWIVGIVTLFTFFIFGATATNCFSDWGSVRCRNSGGIFILWVVFLAWGLYKILLDGQRPSKK